MRKEKTLKYRLLTSDGINQIERGILPRKKIGAFQPPEVVFIAGLPCTSSDPSRVLSASPMLPSLTDLLSVPMALRTPAK